jgi:hypothetical protein
MIRVFLMAAFAVLSGAAAADPQGTEVVVVFTRERFEPVTEPSARAVSGRTDS